MTESGTLRYATEVTRVGSIVPDCIAQGILIWFAEGAPEELHDLSILHRPSVTTGGVQVGDEVWLDDLQLEVLAVGPVVNDNLVNLGHMDLKANGQTEPPMPGDICVEKIELPLMAAGGQMKIAAGAGSSR